MGQRRIEEASWQAELKILTERKQIGTCAQCTCIRKLPTQRVSARYSTLPSISMPRCQLLSRTVAEYICSSQGSRAVYSVGITMFGFEACVELGALSHSRHAREHGARIRRRHLDSRSAVISIAQTPKAKKDDDASLSIRSIRSVCFSPLDRVRILESAREAAWRMESIPAPAYLPLTYSRATLVISIDSHYR